MVLLTLGVVLFIWETVGLTYRTEVDDGLFLTDTCQCDLEFLELSATLESESLANTDLIFVGGTLDGKVGGGQFMKRS